MAPSRKSRVLAAAVQAPARREPAPDEASRLDFDVLNGHLGYFLRRLQVQVFQDFIRTLGSLDIRPAQYSVLILIEANPGRSQAEIGKALNIERAALTKMLHELEDRGWLERHDSIRDARSHALFLSRDGENALARAKALAQEHERRMEALIGSKRREMLMELLREFG